MADSKTKILKQKATAIRAHTIQLKKFLARTKRHKIHKNPHKNYKMKMKRMPMKKPTELLIKLKRRKKLKY